MEYTRLPYVSSGTNFSAFLKMKNHMFSHMLAKSNGRKFFCFLYASSFFIATAQSQTLLHLQFPDLSSSDAPSGILAQDLAKATVEAGSIIIGRNDTSERVISRWNQEIEFKIVDETGNDIPQNSQIFQEIDHQLETAKRLTNLSIKPNNKNQANFEIAVLSAKRDAIDSFIKIDKSFEKIAESSIDHSDIVENIGEFGCQIERNGDEIVRSVIWMRGLSLNVSDSEKEGILFMFDNCIGIALGLDVNSIANKNMAVLYKQYIFKYPGFFLSKLYDPVINLGMGVTEAEKKIYADIMKVQ